MKHLFTFISLVYFSCLYAQPVNLAWAKGIGGINTDLGGSLTLDASGNVYVTGSFQGTIDFDPGPGTNNLVSTDGAIFITKSDPSGNLVWAKNFGGTINASTSIAVDALGNVLISGNFKSTADFDPGPGVFNLSSAGDEDIFILKLDGTGNFVWAKKMGGTLFDFCAHLTVDATGNVYSIGDLSGVADFDPGSGVNNLTSAGGLDVFISKLDASGNFVWAKNIGSIENDFGMSIVADGSGNIYTTGDFVGTVDFDPGAGTFDLTSANGVSAIFINKFDASGNFIWAKSMGGPVAGGGAGYSIALDGSGNIYTTGFFEGTTDFDPNAGVFTLTSASIFADLFVLKLDASGNFIWAKGMGGPGEEFGNSIAADASGVYVAGDFQDSVDFDPGTGVHKLISAGGRDIFISKLDASGNFNFAFDIGGTADDDGKSVATDGSGNIYTTGFFRRIADFDPGAAVFNLFSAGNPDIFIAKYTQPSADLELTKTASTTSLVVGEAVTYTVTLVNKGPSAATHIQVADLAPAGMSFGQVTPSAGSFDVSTGLWSIDALSSGSSATLTIVGTATQPGTIINTAEITASDQRDPDSTPGNGVVGEDDQSSVSVQANNAVGVEALIRQLIGQVNTLVHQGELSNHQGKFLTGLLYISLDFYKHGFKEGSIFILRTFTASVKALVRSHQLSAGDGQNLIVAAQNIIRLIEAELRPRQSSLDRNEKIITERNAAEVKLYPNYPNPFHGSTTIQFDLPKESRTRLSIYDAQGKMITSLLDKVMPAGKHSIIWQAQNLAAGTYLLRFQAGKYTETEQMVLIK